MSILGSLTGGLFDVASGGNWEDTLDPGNFFHEGSAQREANKQWNLEYQLAKQNYDEQVRQYDQNFAHQLEAYNYQKDLNALQMEREDNAVQRRMADLKASGLSPTLAAGSSAGATPLTAGVAPQHGIAQHDSPSDIKARQAMFKEQIQKDRIALATTMLGNFADVSRTLAETKLIDAQANNVSSMTPIDLKLKEQAYGFAQEANPFKLKGLALDVSTKEKDIALKDYDLILSMDEHAQNAYKMYNMYLDGKLKEADIDLKDREYILKGLAIKSAETTNKKLDLEYKNLLWDTDYYHTRNMPIGMNFGMFNPLLGASGWAHEAGKQAGAKVKDFVTNQIAGAYEKANSFVKKIGFNWFDFSE